MYNDGDIEKYCIDNLESNCDIYGGLYTWDEMMDYSTFSGGQGICPEGFHIPTDTEWKVLEGNCDSHYGLGVPEWDNESGNGFDVGGNLKSTGTIDNGTGLWKDPNEGATNAHGFNGLPGGLRYYSGGAVTSDTQYAEFWTSTQSSSTLTWSRELGYIEKIVSRSRSEKDFGFSVRCLRD